jgi:hypothetical protein
VLRRRREKGPIAAVDPAAVEEPWRQSVAAALQARAQFGEVVRSVPKGPLRDRIELIGERVDQGVLASWDTAQRGSQGARLLASLDPEGVTARLKDAKRRHPDGGPEVDALAAQYDAVNRLWDGVDSAGEQLRLLDLRLGAAVARVAALAMAARTPADLDAADEELVEVVDELGALSGAFDALT